MITKSYKIQNQDFNLDLCFNYLEVEVQAILKNETFGKTFVFFHVVGQSKVTIGGVLLRQED